DRAVAAARGQACAVLVEGYREDLIGVPGQFPARAAGHLPQANGGVLAARGEEAAVAAEGGREDLLLVALKTSGRLMGPRIQDEHGLVIRIQAGQPAAVRAIGQDTAFGREQLLAGGHVADAQVILLKVLCPRPCRDSSSIWADGEGLCVRAGTANFLADA